MSPKIRKAARQTAFVYAALLVLFTGMLRTAQQTRRTLYGGQPVLAQITQAAENRYQLALGGGEWVVAYSTEPSPALHRIAEMAEQLPPCTAKLFLRLWFLAGRTAAQTARNISGERSTLSSLRSR